MSVESVGAEGFQGAVGRAGLQRVPIGTALSTDRRPRSFHAPYQSSPPIRVPVHPARAWARLSGWVLFTLLKSPIGAALVSRRR